MILGITCTCVTSSTYINYPQAFSDIMHSKWAGSRGLGCVIWPALWNSIPWHPAISPHDSSLTELSAEDRRTYNSPACLWAFLNRDSPCDRVHAQINLCWQKVEVWLGTMNWRFRDFDALHGSAAVYYLYSFKLSRLVNFEWLKYKMGSGMTSIVMSFMLI